MLCFSAYLEYFFTPHPLHSSVRTSSLYALPIENPVSSSMESYGERGQFPAKIREASGGCTLLISSFDTSYYRALPRGLISRQQFHGEIWKLDVWQLQLKEEGKKCTESRSLIRITSLQNSQEKDHPWCNSRCNP